MKIKLIVSFSLLSMILASCGGYEKAVTAYRSGMYADAAKLCSDEYQKMKGKGAGALEKKGEMAYLTADSYRRIEDYKEAQDWFNRCEVLDYDKHRPEVLLQKAEMLRMMREHEDAIKTYEAYDKLVPGDERTSAGIQACKSNDDLVRDKGREVVSFLSVINKKGIDMTPMFGDRKKSKLYFTSSREGGVNNDKDAVNGFTFTDIWVTERDKKGDWTKPYLAKGEVLNTEYNEGAMDFDDRYKKMFITRCPNAKKENLGCDIWVAEAKGKAEWKEPTKIELKSHDSISVGHPATQDGKFLIFASDMPGGYGGKDLWYTTYDKKADKWSAPQNLGANINTKGDELFPTFALNGDLFFSSNGRGGYGGLDLFRVGNTGDNKWEGEPVLLKAPLNSEHNDFALIQETEKNGFFTSERKNKEGENAPNIYGYVLPPNVFDLKVLVSNLGDRSRVEDAKVTVTGSDGATWEGYTDENGAVFWDKTPQGDRYIKEENTYTMMVEKEGFYENTKPSKITTEGLTEDQQFVIDMGLFPKRPIRLPEVRYQFNSWNFVVDSTINSTDSLMFVYNLLKERPELVLELSSHTDSRGRIDPNQRLSENRARACYKFLVEKKGIDPRRIVPVGKGEGEPRKMWLTAEGTYSPSPVEGAEEILLTEAYINKFRRNKEKFEMLHQFNRRTEGAVRSLDFDPANYPAADTKYLKYVKYP